MEIQLAAVVKLEMKSIIHLIVIKLLNRKNAALIQAVLNSLIFIMPANNAKTSFNARIFKIFFPTGVFKNFLVSPISFPLNPRVNVLKVIQDPFLKSNNMVGFTIAFYPYLFFQ